MGGEHSVLNLKVPGLLSSAPRNVSLYPDRGGGVSGAGSRQGGGGGGWGREGIVLHR